MNDLIVIEEIPEDCIEIIEPQLHCFRTIVVNQTPHVFITKLLKMFVYLFVFIMFMWFFGIFNGRVETGFTVVFVSIATTATIIKMIKSF